MAYLLIANGVVMAGLLGFINLTGSLRWVPKTLLSMFAVANAAYGISSLGILPAP